MSLTSFIAEKDVKARLHEVFPFSHIRLEQRPMSEPLTTHYSLVGTAFDYLLRFSLQRLYAHAVVKPWIAELAVAGKRYALEEIYDEAMAGQAMKIVEEAKHYHRQYLQSGILTNDLLRSVLLLAQIDPFFRVKKLYEPFGIVEDGDIDDLQHLFAAIPFDHFLSRSVCLLDPTFGSSGLVGGADVDLILDKTMIDIKTTKFLQIKREYIDQLLGYYMLYRLGGVTGMPERHVISDLGIYFSRHGYVYSCPVEQFGSEETFTDFLPWFAQRARQQYNSR
ncbi:MAG: hypothetical protein ABI465_10095 [Ktedonobacteraceae bacterium]